LAFLVGDLYFPLKEITFCFIHTWSLGAAPMFLGPWGQWAHRAQVGGWPTAAGGQPAGERRTDGGQAAGAFL